MTTTMKILFLTFLVISPSLQQLINKNSSIVMLIEMISPGDKTPLFQDEYPMPKFNNYLSISEIGKRKHLLLGKHIQTQYPKIFKNLSRANIRAESLDANWTIKSLNSHIVGAYNVFDGEDLGFKPTDPQVLPPEKLTVDPNKVIDFKTALPYGIRFIPIYGASGKENLKFSISHEFCADLDGISSKAIEASNARLGRNDFFKGKLEKIESLLELTVMKGKKSKYLERCVHSLYVYNEKLDEGNETLSENNFEFLRNCETAYLMSIYENIWASKIQAGLTNSNILEKILDRIFHLEDESKFEEIKKEIDIDFGVDAEKHPKKKRSKKKTENLKLYLMSIETSQMLSELIVRGKYKNAKSCAIKSLKNLHQDDCEQIPLPASNFVYELHKTPEGYKIRILYNSVPVQCEDNPETEYCNLKNFSQFLHKNTEKKLKFKCAGHLMHRYPEVEKKGMRTYVHILVSGSLIVVSIVFLVLGFLFRRKLKRLESLIEKELGNKDK